MYDFIKGPLVWVAFGVLVLGSVVKLITLIGPTRRDKVVLPYLNARFALRSLTHWLVPYNSVNMRLRPVFTLLSFGFHVCLLAIPIFLFAHVMLWERNFGIRWPSLPGFLADVMTFWVLVVGLVFVLRRIADPAVRYVTTASDFVILAIILAPFLTGLLARFDAFPGRIMVAIHIAAGCVFLAAIPFTRLVHMLYFPLTRAYMGSEFGFRNARDW